MPKTIHTPRDELICGKIDVAFEYLRDIERGERKVVPLAFVLEHIRHDAERMEAKLVVRKAEVRQLSEALAACHKANPPPVR